MMEKAIITVLGKDKIGIIAAICNYLADSDINVLDISQTILDEYFNMIMIVDLESTTCDFKDISINLEQIGKKIGVIIKIQKEEIFTNMHRI